MAFKMKGSAYKMGNVATKTVLKHKAKASQEEYDTNHPGPVINHKEKGYHTGHEKDGSPIPMKSPMKIAGGVYNPVTGEQSTGTKEDAKALRDIGITTDKYLDEYTDPDYKVKSDYGLQGRIENIVALEEPIFNTVIFNRSEGVATVDLESNSTFFTDSSVTYTWEFFGWDVDRNRNMFNTTTSFNLNILKRKYKPNGGDNKGDISIDSVPDNNLYATEDSSGNGLKASITLNPADRNVDTFPPNARPGARVRVSCYSGGCKVGCQLTVKDNATQRTEVTAIPNIFRTP